MSRCSVTISGQGEMVKVSQESITMLVNRFNAAGSRRVCHCTFGISLNAPQIVMGLGFARHVQDRGVYVFSVILEQEVLFGVRCRVWYDYSGA